MLPGQNPNHDEEDLIETDSDDSDYDALGASGSGDPSFDSDDDDDSDELDQNARKGFGKQSESGSASRSSNGNDEDDDEDDEDNYEDDDDDSDYEEGDEENEKDASSGSSSDGEAGSESGQGSEEGSVDIGSAPFTGYIFPAIHKLVAAGRLEALESYLDEMFDENQGGPQVWEVSDSLGRNAVHLAIIHNNIDILRLLLDYDMKLLEAKFGDDENKWKFSVIRRKFDEMSVVHLAMCRGPWDESTSTQLLDLIFAHPARALIPVLDFWKRTPLHIAVMTGKQYITRYLVEKQMEWRWTVDSCNMLPVHYAIDTKNAALTEMLLTWCMPMPQFNEVLAKLPVDRQLITHCVAKCSWECLVQVCRYMPEASLPERALEIADQLGIDQRGLKEISQDVDAAQRTVMDRSAETAIVYDMDCLGHVRLPDEAEDGHLRLKRIRLVVENPNRLEVLVGQYGSLRTGEFQNLRVIDKVAPCPLADVVRVHEWSYVKRIIEVAESAAPGAMVRLDKGDTNVTRESWAAALKAAGSVVQAMDLVAKGACKNAFVAVRPPGHHVSSRGAVDPNMEDDDTGSNGFCLVNNVAIGAAYALNVHRDTVKRVAMIDIDIHHGNGTEAIVRGLREPKTIRIPLNFTGLTGNLEMHSYHPWLDRNDADNVFFSSVHRFDGRFYPQSGQTGVDGNIVNAGLQSLSTSADFRYAFSHLVLPRLVEFAPDLIMISAGFDGHVRDRLASGEWDITEEDYYWVTEQLIGVANQCCKGRIVSVLEGGYNTKAGWLSPLAQSVASHVRALSSSWASKWVEPIEPESSESEAEEEEESPKHQDPVVAGITELLARADAVINDGESNDSPRSAKRARLDQEEADLFGQ